MKLINACLCFHYALADSVDFNSNVFAALYIEFVGSPPCH